MRVGVLPMDYGKALDDGWAVKLAVAAIAIIPMIVGGVVGWAARRPIEKAGILEAVNERLTLYLTSLEKRVDFLSSALEKCEIRHDIQAAELEQLRGLLMQEKQIGLSTRAQIARDGGT